MNTNLAVKTNVPNPSAQVLEKVLLTGDLATLTAVEKVNYFYSVCESVGLNPLTKPFEFIKLNNKLVLYATRTATDQLRTIKNVSVIITSREKIDDVYVVTAKATMPDGRTDESTGAVTVTGLRAEALANAFMKCETKAKRRVTLSICGLGLLDESEVETIVSTKEEKSVQENPGEFLINFTKGFKGKKISELKKDDLTKLLDWCESKNTMLEFQSAAKQYILESKNKDLPQAEVKEDVVDFESFSGEI